MREIIIIQATDSDGTVFRAIMDTLRNNTVQTFKVTSPVLSFGNIEIFPASRCVLKAGKEVHLNYGEFSILYCMAQSPGRVFSREQLYNAAWNENYTMGTNTVDNTIWRLRNKLEPDPKHPIYIKTVFRVGYKIEIP